MKTSIYILIVLRGNMGWMVLGIVWHLFVIGGSVSLFTGYALRLTCEQQIACSRVIDPIRSDGTGRALHTWTR